ncbi:MAG: undecaprenyl-phosphate glucose phosphotransferase [Muribaculaceae bacterium]|nr:undecaprenyl-phosphate glucose phosphotransferase [Muribaculaceae bacterium]
MSKGRYGHFVKYAIILGDLFILNILYYCIFGWYGHIDVLLTPMVWTGVNIAYLISAFMFTDLHDQRVLFAEQIVVNTTKMCLIYAALLFATLWILNIPDFSLKLVGLFIAILYVVLSLWWIMSRKLIKFYRSLGFNYKRVIIIGYADAGKKLISEMNSDPGYGFKIMGVFDCVPINEQLPYYTGKLSEIEDFIKENYIDEIYCSLSNTGGILERILNVAENNAADFYFVPQVGPYIIRQFELNTVGDIPTLSARPNPLSRSINRVIKRVFDIIVSGFFLAIFPIILIPVAIIIKLTSPGPIFFKQKRTGYRGQEFMCYKFRTMLVNDESDKKQATANDPRKTAFGNWMRKMSIDELPQFYNVFKGDMSIVGPRPHMIKHTQEYSALIDKYMLRHTIKPGITGWAQVNGLRGETRELWQMQRRVEYDVWYTENWNLWLDIKIIVRTIFNAITGEEAAC